MARRRVRRYRKAVYSVSQKRPIDKQIVCGQASVGGTLTTGVQLYPSGGGGATFPGTIAGIRWKVECFGVSAGCHVRWCLIKLREGMNANTVSTAVGPAALYTPEQDVICWGSVFQTGTGAYSITPNEGQTKSMRKLQAGDRIILLMNDNVATLTAVDVMYCFQFFFKT